MSTENDIKFQREIDTPIQVVPGADAEAIGRHYAALHDMQTGPAYAQLGEKVETTFTVEKTSDGGAEVRIVETHK